MTSAGIRIPGPFIQEATRATLNSDSFNVLDDHAILKLSEESLAGVDNVVMRNKVQVDYGKISLPPKGITDATLGTTATEEEFASVPHQDSSAEAADTVMLGVDIFEESDMDDHKLQLYSDIDGGIDSDALMDPSVLLGGIDSKPTPTKVKRKSKRMRDTARLSLEDRIRCIRMCSRYNSYADAQKAWKQTYDSAPPCRKTMSTLDKKFQKTGSVADLIRTGRPKSTRTEAVIARVEAAVNKDPSKSIRTLARELGINQASVHRIKRGFEDKKNTLKTENKKLRERLNEALKRVVLLEKRLINVHNQSEATRASVPSAGEPKFDTLVITAPDGSASTGLASFTSDSLEDPTGTNLPTLIALNGSTNQVLRLPSGQETIHIITLPQNSAHQVLSLDDSSSFQLSIPSTSPSDLNIGTTSFLTSTSSTNNQNTVAPSFVSFK